MSFQLRREGEQGGKKSKYEGKFSDAQQRLHEYQERRMSGHWDESDIERKMAKKPTTGNGRRRI